MIRSFCELFRKLNVTFVLEVNPSIKCIIHLLANIDVKDYAIWAKSNACLGVIYSWLAECLTELNKVNY